MLTCSSTWTTGHGPTKLSPGLGGGSCTRRSPPSLDAVFYSRTYTHRLLPSTVDVHHHFPGLLADHREVFAALWAARTSVTIAHQPVTTTSAPHALVIETVNALRSTPEKQWPAAAVRVRDGAGVVDLDELTRAAASIGAARTAGPLIAALGGHVDESDPDPVFERWRRECGGERRARTFWAVVRQDPRRAPFVILRHWTIPEHTARMWADAHGVRYRSRAQVAALRARKVAGAVAAGALDRLRTRGEPWS